jgi:16S rRNA (cytidine1402-2'-O)-methyltransferase
MSGKLYMVPTPIGNLEDMTLRAIRVLKEVDLVLAEDTRTSSKLLQHYAIETPLRSYHMHNEHKVLDQLITQLQSGRHIALITDAGTPAISDPGFLLSRAAIQSNVELETLAGATAFVPALVNSGLAAHNFCFEGFLPPKKGRKTKLELLKEEKRTIIFYESPYRVVKTLEELKGYFQEDRQVSVSREISKKFEETIRGSLTEVAEHFKKNSPKGEFVICVAGKDAKF